MKTYYRNIAISGDIGTGKSTLANHLADELGWKVISTGDFFRQWHIENNVSLEDTAKIPEDLDIKIDMGYQKKMKEEDGFIFESRLAGWLARDMHDVFKILCICDFEEAMKRVGTRDDQTKEEAASKAKVRASELVLKFKKLYDVDNYLDPNHFDMVVDSTDLTPKEVTKLVMDRLRARK